MVKLLLAKFSQAVGAVRDFLDEKAYASADHPPPSRFQRFAHFWLMVVKSFTRNRCLVRASALAYTTLLGLIPMLFVVISISGGIMTPEGSQRINHLIDRFLITMTPPTASGTNVAATAATVPAVPIDAAAVAANSPDASANTNLPATDAKVGAGREQIVESINGFIANIQRASLGVTGGAMLVCIAIFMLSSIENTFNDIWGVTRGRGWVARFVQYWAVISLGPVVLAVALGLTGGRQLQTTRDWLRSMPVVGHWLGPFLAVVLLCLALALFYLLMPNTRVRWRAALAGGLVGGVLWHLNNYFSVLYVSRWITNSKIYGSLAGIPVFMAGLYFSWAILLFGAQVAYAYQNRAAYLQEKQVENVNQRGREFIALRLMECVGQRFHLGLPPAGVPEIADALTVPTKLVQQLLQTLASARLVVEVAGLEAAYAPARPLADINCHDILLALRAGQGQELATREEPARAGVFGEFEKILEAEKSAASSVTVLTMVNRTEKLTALAGSPLKAVSGAKFLN